MKNKKTKKSTSRVVLTVLCVVLGIILAVLLAGTVYAEYLLGLVNYDDPTLETQSTLSQEEIDAILQEQTEATVPDFTGEVLTAEEIQMETTPAEQIGNEDHITNILLVGKDDAKGGVSRTDSMILCTFNTEKNTITVTSLMRDMYVKIPGYKNNRINAAYAYGGATLLGKTLKENFGVVVDGYVEVGFDGFADVIDLLGGIEVELNSTEAKFINYETHGRSKLKAGVTTLTGEEALWYARCREDAQGDFNRTSRQRHILSLLIEKYKDVSMSKMVTLLKDILPMITTDLSKDQIVSYAMEYFPMLSSGEIVMQRIPVDGGYKLVMIDGMSVIRVDMEKNIQALADSLT